MDIKTASEAQTIEAAQQLAPTLKTADIILLNGTLGMGKTVFARALIRALTHAPELEVPSPTFTLVQTYDSQNGPIHHYDLYRLEDPEEIFDLGWEDSLADAITIVEWPDRLGPYKPARTLDITILAGDNNGNTRQIQIEDKRT